jgi:pseudaminic acid biosynthesis-associated methylase
MKTEQEKFWSSNWGNKYSDRNSKSNYKLFFKKVLSKTKKVNSVYEIGTNVGLNLDSLKKIKSKIKTYGVELNTYAFKKCLKKGHQVSNESIFNLKIKKKFDLVFTCGVLIHINPNRLNLTYSKIFNLSKKYILIAEYFNPTPVKVIYRNNKNKLFKRDFAKEIMNKYNLKLIDYGFLWKEDKRYTADNFTWFLFKK